MNVLQHSLPPKVNMTFSRENNSAQDSVKMQPPTDSVAVTLPFQKKILTTTTDQVLLNIAVKFVSLTNRFRMPTNTLRL